MNLLDVFTVDGIVYDHVKQSTLNWSARKPMIDLIDDHPTTSCEDCHVNIVGLVWSMVYSEQGKREGS